MNIPLTQGQSCIVDAEDYARVSQYKWCAAATKATEKKIGVYAVRTKYTKSIGKGK